MSDKKEWPGKTHPLQDLEHTRDYKRMRKREEHMGHVARKQMRTHEEVEMDEKDLDEALNIQQRQKRAAIMRRYKSKIERAREVAQHRVAKESNIKKRAYAQARQLFRKRLAGERGAEYEKLGPSEKMAIDKMLDNKGKAIKKLALRLIPKVKKAEYERLQSYTKGQALANHGAPEGKISEDFNEMFLEYFGSSAPGNSGSTGERSVNPVAADKIKKSEGKSKNNQIQILGKFDTQAEENTSIFKALEKKADKSGIDLDVLGEVYDRGLDAWSESYNVSPTQYAFARVNSFINKGKTYYTEDADLQEGILSFKEKLQENAWNQLGQKKPVGNTLPAPKRGQVEKHGRTFREGDLVVPHTGPHAGEVHKVTSSRKGSVNIVNPYGHKYDTITVRAKHEHLSPATDQQKAEHNARWAATAERMRAVMNKEEVETNESEYLGEKRGLWDNILAKRKRIKSGSGERMRKPGSEGAPTDQALKAAQESVVEETIEITHVSGHRKRIPVHPLQVKRTLERHRNDPNVKSARVVSEELDEGTKPYVKPHYGTINAPEKQSGWKASNKHGKVQYFGMDFKKAAEKHAGLNEEEMSLYVKIQAKRAALRANPEPEKEPPYKRKPTLTAHDRDRRRLDREDDEAQAQIRKRLRKEELDLDEAKMKGKDPCWKDYEMVGTKKKGGKEVPNCVPTNEEKDPDRNTKIRQKMQYVERDNTPETPSSNAQHPTNPCSSHAKQQRVKKIIVDEGLGNVEPDPKKRLVGTDSLVKAYKKDTPGQSLDESFAMAFDYQGKPSLAPTAAELHMRTQGGFAHHTDVQNVMEVTDIKTKIQKMFETTILEEDKDQLALSYNELSEMVEEAFNLIKKIKESTVERDAWSEAQILKMERYIQSVNAYLNNMYEDVTVADRKGEVVAGHKKIEVDPKTGQQIVIDVPAHVRKAPTGKKIIKTGSPNDGIPG